MKPVFTSLFFIIIVVSFSACTKKESATPVAKHLATDPSRIPDSTVYVDTKVYPYTDTFIGKLAVTYYAYGNDTVDPTYTFYVYNISRYQKVFMSSVPIDLQSGYTITIQDTATSHIDCYYGNMYFLNNVYANAFKFQFSGNSLTVAWDVNDIPILGECDYGESIGQYNGILTSKN